MRSSRTQAKRDSSTAPSPHNLSALVAAVRRLRSLPWWGAALVVLAAISCQATVGDHATVTRIIDGDTLEVRPGRERIRLISVDTPEVRNPAECFGAEAATRTRELAAIGTRVRLERDKTDRDRFGRLLRYVYLPDGRLLSEVLAAEGYARVVFYPPDRKYLNLLREAERSARESRRGLWGSC